MGNIAPDFTLESLDGGKVSLSDYRGNVVLVNFWASWCDPCRTEIPDLEAAYQAHKGQGLIVLGVNVAETRQVVGPSVKAFGISYPVLLDEQDRLMKVYRGLGLPMSLLIDREGVIRERHMGLLTAERTESVSDQGPTQAVGAGPALPGIPVTIPSQPAADVRGA